MELKIKKRTLIIIAILIAAILVIIFTNKGSSVSATDQLAKCIASKSVVYIQTGCSACKAQEDLFGDSYQYINDIDCVTDRSSCEEAGITATPTWVINNQKYVGVQYLDRLKELTGC